MRVSLGTIEVEDDVRKAIRKHQGGKGHATRGDVKDYVNELVENHFQLLVSGDVEPEPDTGGGSQPPEPTAADDSTDA